MTLNEFVVAAGSVELFGLIAVLVALARPRRHSPPAPKRPSGGEVRAPAPARRLA